MRNLILGISILCLALSGVITFKALNLPEKNLRNSASQPPIKIHESSQVAKDTVLKPAGKQGPEANVNQTLQNTISHLEQTVENNITDSQINIQTLENTVKQLEHKLINIDNATQTDTLSSKNTIVQLEQKLTDKIAYSQKDTQSAQNTTDQLEQKLTDKLTDTQINIQALENTVKQLEQRLAEKIDDSQKNTQSAKNTITQPEQKAAPRENTSQNISKIGKTENAEESSSQLLFSVSFDSGKFVIDNSTKKLIEQSTQYIGSLPPNYRVIVEGHTDNSPLKTISGEKYPYEDNMGLSLFRAKTVAGMFEKEGISSKRISAIGYGATRPIATNATSEGRAKNRRVVVRLIPAEKEI